MALLLSSSFTYKQEELKSILQSYDFQPISYIAPTLDALITSEETPEEQAQIAAYIFDYYYSSKIMGYESLALYIADSYFLNKKLTYPNEEGYFMMKLFADFNRSSLIGLDAPDMTLQDKEGNFLSINNIKSEYKILYFYDDQCSNCRIQTPLLMNYISSVKNKDITLIRVFTDSNVEHWKEYLNSSPEYPISDNVKIIDLIDPEMSSNFHKLYAVLSTPQLFLIDHTNTIIGRKLDVESLVYLIEEDAYDKTKLKLLISELFESFISPDSPPDSTKINKTIDILYQKCKDSDKDFRQEMMFTIYQYLKTSTIYEFQCGAIYLAEHYIISKPTIWEGFQSWKYTKNLFIEETQKAINSFNFNKLGSEAPDFKLLNKWGFPKHLHKFKKDIVLYFFDIEQEVDRESLNKFADISTNNDLCSYEPILVYIGNDKDAWRSLRKFKKVPIYRTKLNREELSAVYNIAPLPSIYLINSEKIILGKDITITTFEELFNVK